MEWEVEKVDMAVPISPAELSIKRKAIYKHGSQNNGPAFPGDDPREFWQRAEDRNRNTADLYNVWVWPNMKQWRFLPGISTTTETL